MANNNDIELLRNDYSQKSLHLMTKDIVDFVGKIRWSHIKPVP